ncbi:MAG: DNA gyrase inhibitor YacG [Steroidobacteraceae bacterium]|nr:DNA gyrase inhibitor YacG [Steroidobacteraceae bacterium]
MSPPRVKCPTCGRQIEWSEQAPFRPFCSERCKLIDLGAWLSEQRAIPGDTPAPSGDEIPPEER